MKNLMIPLFLALVLALPRPADAQDYGEKSSPATLSSADVKWGPGPASLPPGAEIAVIQGNPSEKGALTMRLKFPANYAVAPHTHPVMEQVTILSGSLHVGMGKVVDKKMAKTLETGGFAAIPKEVAHYAYTTEPTVIQLNSEGPWGITYINSTDDPRNNEMGSD